MSHDEETVEEILKIAIQKQHIQEISMKATITQLENEIVKLKKRIKELEF